MSMAMSPRWPYPRIVAHRGGGTCAPENTLAAMRYGASLGFRGVEFDVMLSADHSPFLIHDETLERTTTGHGAVSNTTDTVLRSLDAGRWKGQAWINEPIPTLQDTLTLCGQLALWTNIEIKPARGVERKTAAVVAKHTAQHVAQCLAPVNAQPPLRPVLSSFSEAALLTAREIAPQIPRGWLVDHIPADWLVRMQAVDAVAVHCHYKHLQLAQVQALHEAGYAVVCWTVNDPVIARTLVSWGVDCLITDALHEIGPAFY